MSAANAPKYTPPMAPRSSVEDEPSRLAASVAQMDLQQLRVNTDSPSHGSSPGVAEFHDALQEQGPTKTHTVPVSPVRIRVPSREIMQPSQAFIESGSVRSGSGSHQSLAAPSDSYQQQQRYSIPRRPVHSRDNSASVRIVNDPRSLDSNGHIHNEQLPSHGFDFGLPPPAAPFHQSHARTNSDPLAGHSLRHQALMEPPYNASNRSTPSIEVQEMRENGVKDQPGLPYFHQRREKAQQEAAQRASQATIGTFTSSSSDSHSQTASSHDDPVGRSRNLAPVPRPVSTYTLGSELHNPRGRSLTPMNLRQDSLSPVPYPRNLSVSSNGRSPDRPLSRVDLNNSYSQQQMEHQTLSQGNAQLRSAVGANAALLNTKKTLDLYRANAKKTNDMPTQYEFAIFMVNAAREAAIDTTRSRPASEHSGKSGKPTDELSDPRTQAELIREARQILIQLSDRGYQYAQYYLADGYASGLFNNGKPDNGKALPLFVSAGKHGHAEAGYRAGLCYEFGWGSGKNYPKAVQFLRQAASKGHPGAALRLGLACLVGDMGLTGRQAHREGITWLKRANEAADRQHNAGPYELGLLHVDGFGDDVFKDEAYAAQLFTRAAELGHAEASLRMGEAYEHGLLTCPKDPALSIHFYTGAAQAGLPRAMMALCAWYMVGAEPVLERNEHEAYEWALKAAQLGFPKAEYAVGYFTEMGMGCRRDPMEANVWYVKAAEHGEERAAKRLEIIRQAQTFESTGDVPQKGKTNVLRKKKSGWGVFK